MGKRVNLWKAGEGVGVTFGKGSRDSKAEEF